MQGLAIQPGALPSVWCKCCCMRDTLSGPYSGAIQAQARTPRTTTSLPYNPERYRAYGGSQRMQGLTIQISAKNGPQPNAEIVPGENATKCAGAADLTGPILYIVLCEVCKTATTMAVGAYIEPGSQVGYCHCVIERPCDAPRPTLAVTNTMCGHTGGGSKKSGAEPV